MNIHPLYSSSSGNACRVFNNTTSILIDCGVSMKKVFSQGEFDIDAIFVTHEHSDHVGGAGVVCRKIQCPIYIHPKSYERSKEKIFKKCDDHINFFVGGNTATIGDFKVRGFIARHDSHNGGMGLIVTEIPTDKKFSYLTDTGSVTPQMKEEMAGCDAYFLEAGHDVEMLKTHEQYDQVLKDRILGPFGHLSNDQSIELIDQMLKSNFDDIQWITFGHLSERTNKPELVKQAFYSNFSNFDSIHIAPCDILTIN